MKYLKEFDCLSLTPLGDSDVARIRVGRVFPNAFHVSVADLEAQIAALSEMKGAYVLLLPPYILPSHALANAIPDPILLAAEYRIGWMSKNAVTSELVSTPSPELWLRSDLISHIESEWEETKPAIAIIPEYRADWVFNTSSGAAFTAGFQHFASLQSSALSEEDRNKKLVVAAAFGSDAPFADWWHLGILTSLLGATERAAAYEKEKVINDREADMQCRLADLVRQVQLESGLSIQILSRRNSVFFRQNRFLQPERAAYESVASQYDELGKAGAEKAQKYRTAATWVWGE